MGMAACDLIGQVVGQVLPTALQGGSGNAVGSCEAAEGPHRDMPLVTRPSRARDSLGAGVAMRPATSVGAASAATSASAIQWGTVTEVAVPTARSGRADPAALSLLNILAPRASRKARAPLHRLHASARRRGAQSRRWSCNRTRPGTSAPTASRSAGVLLLTWWQAGGRSRGSFCTTISVW